MLPIASKNTNNSRNSLIVYYNFGLVNVFVWLRLHKAITDHLVNKPNIFSRKKEEAIRKWSASFCGLQSPFNANKAAKKRTVSGNVKQKCSNAMRRKVNMVDFEGKKPAAKQTKKQKRNDLQMKTMPNWQHSRLHHLAVVSSDFITFWCWFNSSIESTAHTHTKDIWSTYFALFFCFVLFRFDFRVFFIRLCFYRIQFDFCNIFAILIRSQLFLSFFENDPAPILHLALAPVFWFVRSFVCATVQLISFVNCTLYGGRTHSNWQQQQKESKQKLWTHSKL